MTTSLLSLKSCPSNYAIDEIGYDTETELEVTVTDDAGCPLDLSDYGPVEDTDPDSPTYGQLIDEDGDGLADHLTGMYRAKAAHWTEVGMFDVTGSNVVVTGASAGKMKIMFPKNPKIRPGIYLSELSIREKATGKVLVRDQRYLQITPTLEYNNHGAITVPEVRMAIMDFPCKNTLLEDYEFTAAEVMFAIRRPVDLWNETPPIISLHTVATFPYRENWIMATIGFLFRSLAAKQRRNEMTFQADTITIKDNDKHRTYEDLGDMYVRQYREWMAAIKVNLNAQAAFFSIGSVYSRRTW